MRKCTVCKKNTVTDTTLGEVCTNNDCGYIDGMDLGPRNKVKKPLTELELGFLVSAKSTSSARLSYKIVLVDIDSSTFSDTVQAYSFEDALTRIRAKFKGHGIKSVEVI